MNQIRLVVADIDGTLINSQKRVPELTLSQIRRVQQEFRIPFILASSRMPASILRLQSLFTTDRCFVAYDGAVVAFDGALIKKTTIERGAAEAILGSALAADLFCAIYSTDSWAVREVEYWALREIRGTQVWPTITDLEGELRRSYSDSQGLHKIMCRGDRDAIDSFCERLAGLSSDVALSRTRPTIVEIRPSHTNKLQGLEELAKRMSVPMANILAFGDSVNDLEMIQQVGVGIAMHNASAVLKKVAADVTLSNDEDGVGYSLLKYFPPLDRRPAGED